MEAVQYLERLSNDNLKKAKELVMVLLKDVEEIRTLLLDIKNSLNSVS